nr:hypothetical protein Itr_chr09CG16120 [Ipomoea trifida]
MWSLLALDRSLICEMCAQGTDHDTEDMDLMPGKKLNGERLLSTSSEELEPIETINVVQQTSSCWSEPTTRAPDQDWRKWILGINVGSRPSLLRGTQDLLIDSPEAGHSSDCDIG